MKASIVILFALFLFSGNLVSARQADTARYYTSFDGVKIYYEVKGNGYPVVLIHGFTGNGEGWKTGKLYYNLVNSGYKVILLDQRGNGRSDKPHSDAAYSNDAEAKDIMGLVSSLNITNYDIVGYSRGSIIAKSPLVNPTRQPGRTLTLAGASG